MKNTWNKISNLGLEEFTEEEILLNHRNTLLLNRLSMVLVLIMTTYFPIEIIFHGYVLVPVIFIQIVLMAVTLLINKKKKYKAAIYYFMAMSLMLVYPTVFLVPDGGGTALFLLPCSIIGLLFLKNNFLSFSYWLISVLLYISTVLLRPYIPHGIDVPEETLKMFYPIFVCIVFIMFYFVLRYLKNINEDYGKTIEKQKSKIQHDGLLLAEKNKEITDSINYAKRIQEAILPPLDIIKKHLPLSFVLYQPKDIVAGDFYWFEQVENHSFIAAADCTGHGVPGALVSVVCSNALNRSLHESEITEPGKLLDNTRELVLDTLSKNDKDVKDGMDISLCRITPNGDRAAYDISWAGANNSLLYFQNGELKELNPDKQPVGKTEIKKPFTTHDIQLRKGDLLLLYTDGYSDQFGGPKGKKFKFNNLKKIIAENSAENPETINTKLQTAFENWKGELEQIDDVCIIGIRF